MTNKLFIVLCIFLNTVSLNVFGAELIETKSNSYIDIQTLLTDYLIEVGILPEGAHLSPKELKDLIATLSPEEIDEMLLSLDLDKEDLEKDSGQNGIW